MNNTYSFKFIFGLERPDHDIRWRRPQEQAALNKAGQLKRQQQQAQQTGYVSAEHHTLPASGQSSLLELTEIHHPVPEDVAIVCHDLVSPARETSEEYIKTHTEPSKAFYVFWEFYNSYL
jgi:hypothetical protein